VPTASDAVLRPRDPPARSEYPMQLTRRFRSNLCTHSGEVDLAPQVDVPSW
jgi:hypothetical protein